VTGVTTLQDPSRASSIRFDSRTSLPPIDVDTKINFDPSELSSDKGKDHQVCIQNVDSEQTIAALQTPPHQSVEKIQMETVTKSALPAPRMKAQPPALRDRVDYLAGLVALCAVIVTVMHFGLTFVPAIVIPGAPQHAESEWWAQKIVAPFILNQMWLGVFFTTSVSSPLVCVYRISLTLIGPLPHYGLSEERQAGRRR
jgi:hypothetical protein